MHIQHCQTFVGMSCHDVSSGTSVLQEVNENSLKRLNGYLENLQKPGSRSVQPMKLTFYIRNTKYSSKVQPELISSGAFLLKCSKYQSGFLGVLT